MTPAPELAARLERLRNFGLGLALIGGAATLGGWLTVRDRFHSAWLTAYLYWTELSLGCLAVTLLHGMSGGGWGRTVRRIAEAGCQTLPLMALLFAPLWFEAPR